LSDRLDQIVGVGSKGHRGAATKLVLSLGPSTIWVV
jgi:hypothetical protein